MVFRAAKRWEQDGCAKQLMLGWGGVVPPALSAAGGPLRRRLVTTLSSLACQPPRSVSLEMAWSWTVEPSRVEPSCWSITKVCMNCAPAGRVSAVFVMLLTCSFERQKTSHGSVVKVFTGSREVQQVAVDWFTCMSCDIMSPGPTLSRLCASDRLYLIACSRYSAMYTNCPTSNHQDTQLTPLKQVGWMRKGLR